MKVIKYPDGQVNVQLEYFDKSRTSISQRINSYEDLFILKSKKEVLDHNNIRYVSLFIPCLFGQRSDIRFQEDESFGLKIITDFINDMNFNSVEILDPHSAVGPGLIKNSKKRSSFSYVEEIVRNFNDPELVLVSPDAGAYKKIFQYAEALQRPLVAANKFRDLQGNITLNVFGDVKDKQCLIVDDLLDGGYTFHLLAEQLKNLGASKVFLYVTHAYFNKGYNFSEFIDGYFCTNSVKDIPEFVTDGDGKLIPTNVKQFTVI